MDLKKILNKLTVEVISKNLAAHSSCLYCTPTTATGADKPSLLVTNTALVAVTLVSFFTFPALPPELKGTENTKESGSSKYRSTARLYQMESVAVGEMGGL